MEFLKYADKTLIVKDGAVEDSTGVDKLVNEILKVESHRAPDSDNKLPTDSVDDSSDEIAKENELDDLTRSTGDFAVYKYYFRHVGWFYGSLFVGFVIVEVFSFSFARKWPKTSSTGARMLLLTHDQNYG